MHAEKNTSKVRRGVAEAEFIVVSRPSGASRAAYNFLPSSLGLERVELL